jgi:imidazole glycerol-phosphate synthase subunit HisH
MDTVHVVMDARGRESRGTAAKEPGAGTDCGCVVITVVDMGLSNLGSVLHALARLGVPARATRDADEVRSAAALVLPGVGAFGDGMRALRGAGLVDPVRAHARAGRPLLGICLGMQLLADEGSEHGRHAGLGLVPGRVERLRPGAGSGQRVPNIGWCDVRTADGEGPVPEDACLYFVHSYHLVPEDPAHVAAWVDLMPPVAAAVRRGAVWGVQFHPEKSQDAGLAVLDRFVAAARAAAADGAHGRAPQEVPA